MLLTKICQFTVVKYSGVIAHNSMRQKLQTNPGALVVAENEKTGQAMNDGLR